jgi:hypothetical protein
MKNAHSLSTTVFKIIIRFFEDGDNYEESSLVLLDIAHQEGKPFENIKQVNCDIKSHLNQPKDLFSQHASLCKVVKTYSQSKLKKFKHRPRTDYCNLTILLRYYLFGRDKIVLVTNVNPSLEHAEENLKVFYFSQLFKEALKNVDGAYSDFIMDKLTKFPLNREKERYIEREKLKDLNNQLKEEIEVMKENKVDNKNFEDKTEKKNENDKGKWKDIFSKDEQQENSSFKNINDLKAENEKKVNEEKGNPLLFPSKIFSINLQKEKTSINAKETTPSNKIITLSKEEKNNLYKALQKNAPVKKIIKTFPLKSTSSSIFKDWQLSENKKCEFSINQINEDRISNTEIERMKEDYKKLQIKFEEQEKLIKKILEANQALTKEVGENPQVVHYKCDERKEKTGEVPRIIDYPIYKDSLELINSNLFEGYVTIF